MGLVGPQTD